MDKDLVMFLIGGVFVAIYFVAAPALFIVLTRHDSRARDSKELGPEDIGLADLQSTAPEVQAALKEYSVHHITQAEFEAVLQKARTS